MADAAGIGESHRVFSAGVTDQGSVRGNNEDEIYFDDQRGIYFVVDGMGGHAAGEQAAAIAKERLKGRLERKTGTPEQRIREAITLANNEIFDTAAKRPEWRGMACVLTVMVLEGTHATVGHVGDSRLYKITRTEISKITRDHSPVGEMEDNGELTEAAAMKHPRRNEVYRDVGSKRHEPQDGEFIDIFQVTFEPDTAMLLCSDGLSDAISSKEILEIVRENAGDRNLIVRRLADRAIEDGKDNVSVVFVAGPAFARPAARNGAKRKRRTAVVEVERQPPMERTAVESVRSYEPRRPRLNGVRAALWVAAGAAAVLLVQFALGRFSQPAPPQPRGPQRITVQPGPGEPVSAALASAQPGDTVELAPGEYVDTVHVKNGVVLVGRGAVLRGGLIAEALGHAFIEGVKIAPKPASNMPVAVDVRSGDVRLKNVDVSGAFFAGVQYSGDSDGALEGCTIHDNYGTGVAIRDRAAPTLIDNRIVSNGRATQPRPGVLLMTAGSVRLLGNTIANNGAEAIWTAAPAGRDVLAMNSFSLAGRAGKPSDVRMVKPGEAP